MSGAPGREPFGSRVLAVAVTMIEVGLIVTLMASKEGDTSTLARDTVFAAAMIACNGIVGLSILVAALRDRVASFNAEGSATAFATVVVVATLSLVLPTFTEGGGSGEFSSTQLAFAAIASATLYGVFLVLQTVRHLGLGRGPCTWRSSPPSCSSRSIPEPPGQARSAGPAFAGGPLGEHRSV